LLDLRRIDDMDLAICDDDRALLGARERGELAVLAHLLQRVVENVGLVERENFRLVREEEIDLVPGETAELVAKAVDAETVGKRERDETARLVRDLRRLQEGVLRAWLVPEIAFHVSHGGCLDRIRVDIVRRQLLRR